MFKRNILKSFINEDKLVLNIDEISENNIISMIPSIIRLCKKKKLLLKFETNNPLLVNIQSIINCKDINKKYELIYDYTCDYLDNELTTNNYCDFIDGKCIANRMGCSVHDRDGCCYNSKKGLCDKLVDSQCTNKNPSCKFFFCSYLEKRYLIIKPNDIPQIKFFLNHRQKEIIARSFFKTRQEIIRLLIKAE